MWQRPPNGWRRSPTRRRAPTSNKLSSSQRCRVRLKCCQPIHRWCRRRRARLIRRPTISSRQQAQSILTSASWRKAASINTCGRITSAFRDDYRQSIASGLKAAADKSYHGGSFRGGYGHGLAADVVSVKGMTQAQRWISTENLWNWIDAHGKDFGIGRPYLDKDPPHVAPVDGKEYAAHRRGTKAQHASSQMKKRHRLTADDDGAGRTTSSPGAKAEMRIA